MAVIIPCYEQGHFLGRAIESVLAQSRRADEIVVIDDGSPDDTSGVAEAFADVRCIRQKNRGLAGARNRGIEATTSEFLVFLDADDRLLPNALKTGVDALLANPNCAFVWGFNRPIDTNGRPLGDISNPFSGEATYARLLEANVVGPPVGVMFRRGPVVSADGFSSALSSAEDYDLYVRLARDHALLCHGRTIAEYRYHDRKMSDDHDRMLQAVLAILNREMAQIQEDNVLRAAISRGLVRARMTYGIRPQMNAIVRDIRRRHLGQAIRGLASLLAEHPILSLREGIRRARAKRRDSDGRPN